MKLRSYLLHDINLYLFPRLLDEITDYGPAADELCLFVCVRLSVRVLFRYKAF